MANLDKIPERPELLEAAEPWYKRWFNGIEGKHVLVLCVIVFNFLSVLYLLKATVNNRITHRDDVNEIYTILNDSESGPWNSGATPDGMINENGSFNYPVLLSRLQADLTAGRVTEGPIPTGFNAEEIAQQLVNGDDVPTAPDHDVQLILAALKDKDSAIYKQVSRLARYQVAYYWNNHDAVAKKRNWRNVIKWSDVNY